LFYIQSQSIFISNLFFLQAVIGIDSGFSVTLEFRLKERSRDTGGRSLLQMSAELENEIKIK
jgi:hypothetical protein